MAGIFVFDTLQYVKKLKEAGVGEKAAEVHAEAIKEMIDNNLATKGDIYDLKRDIETVRSDLKRDIETTRSDLKRDIEIVKKDLTIRMGGMLSVAIGVIGVLIALVDRLH